MNTNNNNNIIEFKDELIDMAELFANKCDDTKEFIQQIINTPNQELTFPTGLMEHAREYDWFHHYESYRTDKAYQGIKVNAPSAREMMACLNKDYNRSLKARLILIATFDDDISCDYRTLIQNELQQYMDRRADGEFS
jgi:hypothetical protein